MELISHHRRVLSWLNGTDRWEAFVVVVVVVLFVGFWFSRIVIGGKLQFMLDNHVIERCRGSVYLFITFRDRQYSARST